MKTERRSYGDRRRFPFPAHEDDQIAEIAAAELPVRRGGVPAHARGAVRGLRRAHLGRRGLRPLDPLPPEWRPRRVRQRAARLVPGARRQPELRDPAVERAPLRAREEPPRALGARGTRAARATRTTSASSSRPRGDRKRALVFFRRALSGEDRDVPAPGPAGWRAGPPRPRATATWTPRTTGATPPRFRPDRPVADGSSAAPTLVLLVGAPRSGTTWLQTMLAAHPEVASPQETDLFRRYLEPLTEAWQWQLRGGPEAWAQRRLKGLPTVLTTEEFTEITRDFAAAIVRKAAALRPGATIVLEKSPSTSLCADVIAELTPDARVVHLVARRPRRGVVARRGLRRMGPLVGPAHPAASRRRVGHARARRPGSRRARRPVPRGPLRSALEPRPGRAPRGAPVLRDRAQPTPMRPRSTTGTRSTGWPAPPRPAGSNPVCSSAATSRPTPRTGWSRRASTARARSRAGVADWTTHDRLAFDAIAGDLLVELGYEPDHRWAADPMRSRVYRYQAAASAAVGKSTRWLGRQGERLSQRTPRGMIHVRDRPLAGRALDRAAAALPRPVPARRAPRVRRAQRDRPGVRPGLLLRGRPRRQAPREAQPARRGRPRAEQPGRPPALRRRGRVPDRPGRARDPRRLPAGRDPPRRERGRLPAPPELLPDDGRVLVRDRRRLAARLQVDRLDRRPGDRRGRQPARHPPRARPPVAALAAVEPREPGSDLLRGLRRRRVPPRRGVPPAAGSPRAPPEPRARAGGEHRRARWAGSRCSGGSNARRATGSPTAGTASARPTRSTTRSSSPTRCSRRSRPTTTSTAGSPGEHQERGRAAAIARAQPPDPNPSPCTATRGRPGARSTSWAAPGSGVAPASRCGSASCSPSSSASSCASSRAATSRSPGWSPSTSCAGTVDPTTSSSATRRSRTTSSG